MATKRLIFLCVLLLTSGIAHPQTEILRYTENTNSDTEIALGYPVPIPVDSLTGVDGFRSYASLFAQHQDLMLSNAHINGQVVGHTHAGREIWAYRIGDSDGQTIEGLPEPAVFINGTIHAREWQSPEVVTELYEYLTSSKEETITQYLIDNLNIVLLPVLNVDGFLQTQRYPSEVTPTAQATAGSNRLTKFAQPRDGRMRRKNMLGVDEFLGTGEDRLEGVDLNRNSNQFFGNHSTSDNPTSLVYAGPAPASEPEIQALLTAADLAPTSRLRLYIDVHSFSQVFFMPFTNTARQNANSMRLARKMIAATNALGTDYVPIPSLPGQGIATTADFFANTYDIPAWTLEVEPPGGFEDRPDGSAFYGGNGVSHDGFIMPDAEIARAREILVPMQLLGFYHQAGPPYLRALHILNQDNDELVYNAHWQTNTEENLRDLVVTTNKPLEANQNYTALLYFSKPMRTRDTSSNEVINFSGQNVSLYPQISLTGTSTSGQEFNQPITPLSSRWLILEEHPQALLQRYNDDTLAVNFTMPATLPIGDIEGASKIAFRVEAQDLAALSLDSNPATIVDWNAGGWSHYEDSEGNTGDTGGADQTLQLTVNSEGQAVPENNQGGGGAISLFWLTTVMSVLLLTQNRSYFTNLLKLLR